MSAPSTDLTARFAAELRRYRSEFEDPAKRELLVRAALPRIVATLSLLPPATPESKLLELGSAPYLMTQCLDVAWPGRVRCGNYFGTVASSGTETLYEMGGTGTRTYAYEHFNIEVDEFPYSDASFDVVLFSELIEHLAINPVWTLAEIHRVLRPGGYLIVTTPNALSIDRLDEFLYGGSSAEVDYYSPTFGYGARHNREYEPVELRELLEATGFDVEVMSVRELFRYDRAERLRRWLKRAALRLWSAESHHAHIFLRARRGPVFRWRFPHRLFGTNEFYDIVRDPVVEMGVNDAIHCYWGWQSLEGANGEQVRRTCEMPAPTGSTCHLRGIVGRRRVTVRLRPERGRPDGTVAGEILVHERGSATAMIGVTPFTIPVGTGWTTIETSLTRGPIDREHLGVTIRLQPGQEVAVQRIALEP
jgi:SAM-dependent methyltransferase